ncbi:hypothetical protein CC80DRAFT_489013 [Byssothecium circinans]|uniref:Uncharacterized protein n=1 Tax=Byssothecium circinans TaxID=147558 RepID=A0A6A5U8U5_9PLEO|nr:hypothetical protein CC80DRAFT_489013 [Byssothecium circinans]
MPFSPAHALTPIHIIPQPADLALSPPESYLYIQDFLIILCALLYTLCYIFYTLRTYHDRFCAGTPLYLSLTMAYEVYYALLMTSAAWERACFLVWFAFDACFVAVAVTRAYPRKQWGRMLAVLGVGFVAGLGVLRAAGVLWRDDLEMVTAYWTGVLLQLPIGWASVWLLYRRRDTRGQSLEIWITRYLGCITAFGVFIWRYVNVPENWAYVGGFWSVALMAATLFPETIYPFVYLWAYGKERERERQKPKVA